MLLRHPGGSHALDSLVVVVGRLLFDRFAWYVDSHFAPGTRSEVVTLLDLGT